MTDKRTSIHGQWSSRWAFILAATGSAVGLGNIWRFPYLTGENGGGVFVMVYLVCVFLVGIPILMAEVMLGRRGRQSPSLSSGADRARHATGVGAQRGRAGGGRRADGGRGLLGRGDLEVGGGARDL